MPRPRTAALLLAIAAATFAAGCSGTKVLKAGSILRVAVAEYRLSPQRVRVAPGLLTIVAHNYGRLTHNVVVLLDGHSQGSTAYIPPGQSAEVTVSLAAGTYTIASTVQSDEALGTYGTLVVG
jgi:plastocyanin